MKVSRLTVATTSENHRCAADEEVFVFHFDHRITTLLRSKQSQVRAVTGFVSVVALVLIMPVLFHLGACATASDAGPLARNEVRSATELYWRQSPSSPLETRGKNTVTLSPCPPGVIATEPWYYVYISGSGNPEAVKVTGGTCKGDDRIGTLEFTTEHSHPSGYVIGSASGGIQEASIAARFTPTNPTGLPQSGRVVIPPGEYNVFAPISIRASDQTVDFSGAILNCYTPNDACVFVGDHGPSTYYDHITLISPRGRPMMVAGTKPFVEVNAQQTRIFNVATRRAPPGNSFGSYVQVDDDQAFLLDGLEVAKDVTCNPQLCGAYVSAPGPFNRWSAVGWLKHLNLGLQCAGKGVEWLSGNGLRISDSVIQGWSVFGVRVSNHHGGFGGFVSENVYYEAAPNCGESSPMGNVGNAGIIAEGAEVKMSGVPSNGVSGAFPNWGARSGSHDWLYWVVPVHAQFGSGVPLPAGYAMTDGSGRIKGTFPKIGGASSYKVLRIDWNQQSVRPYPEGTGKYLVATVQQTSCAALTCSFTDNGGEPASYTNPTENLQQNFYMPRLDFWPGAVVLSSRADMSTGTWSEFAPPLTADVLGAGAIVSTLPLTSVSGEAGMLIATAAAPPAAANLDALNTNGTGGMPGATILKAANGAFTHEDGHKGRLNFGHHGQIVGFTPLITLVDSNWGRTWAAADHRPTVDVNDLDLGYEGGGDIFYSRAEHEIREYVGKLPDGSPAEKLTTSAKTFNVPVTINGDLMVTGKCAGCDGQGNGGAGAHNSVSLTGQATAISPKSLCANATCGTGQYRITYYLDSTGTCSAPGNAGVALEIGWKDETAARTMKVPLAGSGVVNNDSMKLGAVSSFGSGEISLWSKGDAAITYSTSYTGCSSGSGTYALRIMAERIQ